MVSRWECALQGSELQPEIKPRCSSNTFMAQPGGPAPRFAACTAKPHMHHEHFIVCFGIRSTYVEETHSLFQLHSQTVSEVEDKKKRKKKQTLFIAVAVDSTSEDAPCESLGLITQKSTLTSFFRCLNECAWMDFLLQPPQKT